MLDDGLQDPLKGRMRLGLCWSNKIPLSTVTLVEGRWNHLQTEDFVAA